MRVASIPLALCGGLFLAGLGCKSSGGDGGTGGSVGSAGTSGSGTAGTSGNAGTNGSGTAGTNGSGTAGTNGGSAGTNGGSAGTNGGSAGTNGGSAGTSGGSAGTNGGRGGTNGGRGGTNGGSAGTTGAGGTGTASCTFTPTSSVSTKIPTVGIVTWSTSLSGVTEAHIDFGLTTSYGMTAPVDLTQASYRTLLLGMKASMMYHYRITASAGGNTCASSDYTVMTGALPNGTALPKLMVTTINKTALYGGFLVTGSYMGATNQSFILDIDGAFVWWYADGSDGCGTRMSYDGKYMWMANGNVPGTNPSTTHVHRVTMDGLTDTDFSTPFANMSHQVTPLPDGSVAFYAYNSNGCDDIKLFPANGTPTSTATTLVNAKTAHGGTTNMCHVNNIEYSASDDTLVFSDLDNDCLTKVSRTTGATVWVLNGINGVKSTFTGDLWTGGEHGFHIISPNDYLIFNNDPNGAIALELMLDPTAKTSKKLWSYTANPVIKVSVLGDVQRMTANGPNGAGSGNTIVDFGTGDAIHEVNASGTVLQTITSGNPFGFMEKRATLYGPSTK